MVLSLGFDNLAGKTVGIDTSLNSVEQVLD